MTRPFSPPKPAVRKKLLKGIDRPVDRKSSEQSDELTSIESHEDEQSSTSISKSMIPASISETRFKQQQAINKELAERHRSFKMKRHQESENNPVNPVSQEETKHSDQLAKFIDNPLNTIMESRVQGMEKPQDRLNPLPNEHPNADLRPYPKKVFFIVANEFCERFSYYGLRTVLVLYFKNVLGFNDSRSTILFHMFAALCYFTPVLGAILGDSVLGKFHTILYLSVVYFIGEVILVISSVIWDSGQLSYIATFVGLFLIGLGTGGIKPCVSAFGGDQFLAHESDRRQAFFSIFYASINLGSLVSMFITPMLRSDFQCMNRMDCYPLAFGLPCLLMLTSIIVFLMAKNQYNLAKLPERNVIVAFTSCVCLALKRKILCHRQISEIEATPGSKNAFASDSSTSSSSLSMSSHEGAWIVAAKNPAKQVSNSIGQVSMDSAEKTAIRRSSRQPASTSHWIYLASDRFDTKSLEDFRSVLGIMLLFVPIPVYWCLYDQQGSLWTLQAARMDGRIFGTNFHLQPDQISVANPILLLATIPVFECMIYPGFRRFNMLTNPVSRITVGGILAALAFVVSAAIEVKIQNALPALRPSDGRGDLLFVNGLGGCTIINTTISHVHIPNQAPLSNDNQTLANGTIDYHDRFELIREIEPLESAQATVLSSSHKSLNNYKIKFHLTNSDYCPFDSNQTHELSLGIIPEKATRLLYLQQGNGKLHHLMFNESLSLPEGDRARVRLLFESFGSLAVAEKRKFQLVREIDHHSVLVGNSSEPRPSSHQTGFIMERNGIVFYSSYLDVEVPVAGQKFKLVSADDSSLHFVFQEAGILLKPGTRNMIVLHQVNSTHLIGRHNLLLDNDYRINILYQLIPYLMISISEVMFSITGLEFSYAAAPENMKSVILGAWCLTTAFGNILTVVVESIHPFSEVTYDFLFYAIIMVLDMLLFAYIGYRFKPHGRNIATAG